MDLPTPETLATLDKEEQGLARRLATRSIVLLENRGETLPLDPGTERVAVVGPIADSSRDLMGDYSHLVHMATLADTRNEGIIGAVVDHGDAFDQPDRRTIVEALRDRLGADLVEYAPGTGLTDGSDEDLARAIDVIAASDVAISCWANVPV